MFATYGTTAVTTTTWAEVDEQGRLVLPPETTARFGLRPGARLRLDTGDNDIRLHRPISHLAKVYVEPTDRCNIACLTCYRNNWEVEYGRMEDQIFERILDGLREVSPPPAVFFGGIGEPLTHPGIVDMIARVKELGARAEMITNGTLLTLERSKDLIAAGLDSLWVSIDGANPESFADVRVGAELPQIIENLMAFRRARKFSYPPHPELGIVFVAMERNIAELPDVLALGRRLGAMRFMVTNYLPHTADAIEQILYKRSVMDIIYLDSPWLPKLDLPKIDIDERTGPVLLQALSCGMNVTLAGLNLSGANDACTFIESGSMAVAWDGGVSPCTPLMHTHGTHLKERKRLSRQHVIGNVGERDLLDLWNDPDYVAYRSHVQSFAFPPCTFCGGCDMSESNEEDCLSNQFPVCGGCLWAQGVVQCP